jgi:DNA-binding Xre family transcriptional regulator
MRLIDYLDKLNWTQTRLADEADISTSTVKRALDANSINRDSANAICIALSRGLKREITIEDVNELQQHQRPALRGPRKPKEPPGPQILG